MKQFRFKFRVESIRKASSDAPGFNAQLICNPSAEMLSANADAQKHIEQSYRAANPDTSRVPSFMVQSNGVGFLNIKLANIKQIAAAVGLPEDNTEALLSLGKGIIITGVATAYNTGDKVIDTTGAEVVDRETGQPILVNDSHVNFSIDDVDASEISLNPIQRMVVEQSLKVKRPIEEVWGEKALSKNQRARLTETTKQNLADFTGKKFDEDAEVPANMQPRS